MAPCESLTENVVYKCKRGGWGEGAKYHVIIYLNVKPILMVVKFVSKRYLLCFSDP